LAVVGALAGVEVRVAAPAGYQLPEGETPAVLFEDPYEAVAGADAIYTDVWFSMGEEAGVAKREALAPYRVADDLLSLAADRAVVLHCLPAHPGEEISAEVLYGPRSAVFDQAENRLHAQKALLEMLLT
jgi:ornithine carbamoyltransferase